MLMSQPPVSRRYIDLEQRRVPQAGALMLVDTIVGHKGFPGASVPSSVDLTYDMSYWDTVEVGRDVRLVVNENPPDIGDSDSD